MFKNVVKYFEQPLAITDSLNKAQEVIADYKSRDPEVNEKDFTIVSIKYIPDEEEE